MICPGCDLPFVGLRTDDNFDMFVAPCPEDLFWHLARRLRKISALPNTGMKILEQRFGSD
jgi:hypothetical protein